ncbi:hypothetical protein [Streptomyces sp. NPDC051992]|uniref:hypothetical protein n=1 Tax=Streptomyces sp. NPDC051992 TaxID=3161012 RepID=UPI0034120512
MRITLMTHDQRAALGAEIAGHNPAAPELVAATVAAAPAADVAAIVARLLAVEQLLATTRETLARLAADADDYDVPEILWELEKVGAAVPRAELEHAEHLLDAVGRAGAF